MRLSNNSLAYIAPQSEVIVVRVESNFLGSDTGTKSFSASFDFEKSGVEDFEGTI